MKRARLFFLLTILCIFSLTIFSQSGRRPVQNPNAPSSNAGAGKSAGSAGGVCPTGLFPGEYGGLPAKTTTPSQSSSSAKDPNAEEVLKIDTTLVTIPVTVLDRGGRFIPTLTKCDFHLYEDDVRQEVAEFTSVETPFNVVLLLDTSGSTAMRIEDIHDAAIAFTEQLRPKDKVMVVSFDSRIKVLADFTSNREELRRAILSTHNGGSTKLYDAVDEVITQYLSPIQGRKAIVLFTDGVDTSSKRASDYSTIQEVEESDVIVYPIQYNTEGDLGGRGGYGHPGHRGGGMGNPLPFPFPIPGRRWPLTSWAMPQQIPIGRGGGDEDYVKADRYLKDLAIHSGGTLYRANSALNASDAFNKIAEELRHQYSISYYPSNTAQDGTYRRIKIRVSETGWAVKAKDGYRAPGNGGTNATNETNRPVLRRRNFDPVN